ncbi:hypothetical protein HK105_202978 [Polyrhizophydium stewartii]|uniref:AP complex mu/sigma subunit domain-containing protein n=1 Tax=Polyrhizophydium stewartii TaxID=2732419 RepID=A0ABR4ND04_9FUNG
MSNLVDYRGSRLVYKRYASLCFCIDDDDNELIALEIIHRYVQVLDRCKAIIESYALLDELLISGEMVEPSLNSVLKVISKVEEAERDSILMENLVRHSLA